MIEFLYDKLSNWSQYKSDEFHKNIPVVPWRNLIPKYPLSKWHLPDNNDGMFFWNSFIYHGVTSEKYIWEVNNNCYLFYRSHTVYYFENGFIHRLSHRNKRNDWILINELYKISQDRSYRMDIPIEEKIYNMNGIDFQYTIVQRPNKEIGMSPKHSHVLGLIDYNFLKNYIDQSIDIMRDIKHVDKNNGMIGTPDIGSVLSKVVTDSFGLVWIDIKDWTLPFDMHVKKTDGMLNYSLSRSSEVSVLTENEKIELSQYALLNYASLINNDSQSLVDYNTSYLKSYLETTG
jgi:hypothetical protein